MTSPEIELRARVIAALADGFPVDWAAIEREGLLPGAEIDALKLVETLRRGAAADRRAFESTPPALPRAFETGFEVVGLLGRGATSEVWLARDKSLRRDVALKVLRSDPHVAGLALERFLQEARTLAAIEHPNVVRIYAITEQGADLCLILELIRGETLERRVHDGGPLSAEEAARVGADLARALSAMHRRGLVHRDLKPGNVMREEGGRTVLLDFGLVRSPDAMALGRSGSFAGTPLFMAPEQFEGREPFGPATDLYGLGALLYWLVTARHPCPGTNFEQVRARTLAGGLTPIVDARPDVPAVFASIVARALETDPARRFASAGEMETALRGFLGGNEHGGTGVGVSRRRRVLLRIGWACMLALLVLAAVWLIDATTERATPTLRAGESCADPLLIQGPGAFEFDTSTFATDLEGQFDADCDQYGQTGIVRDIWYRWTYTGEVDAQVTLSFCGSSIGNPKVAVRRGLDCGATLIVCKDDERCRAWPVVCFPASVGETFFFQIGCSPADMGATQAAGTFTICYTDSPSDCDGNGVRDSCDLVLGLASDCNGNSVPDACDVASGRSEDRNANKVPDECEVERSRGR